MGWVASHRFGIWAFLIGIAFIPGLMSAAILGRWAIIAIGIPLVAQIRFNFPPAIQFAVAMGMAWACASIMVAPDTRDSALQFFFMAMLVGVMGVASQLESLDDPLEGLCWAMGVSSLFAISALLGHRLVDQGSIERYSGLFYNSEVWTEIAAPLAVWAIVSKRWVLVPLTAFPLFLNGSRISVFCVGVALLYAYWPRTARTRVAVLTAAVAVIGAVLIHQTYGAFKLGSLAQRFMIWDYTAMAITPAGQGIGWYRASHVTEEFAHSDVIQALAELGLGALCFAVIPVYALWHRRGTNAERAAFIVICIELVVSFPLHVPANAFLVALLAGYLVRSGGERVILRPESGNLDGADGEWHSQVRGDNLGYRRFRSFMVSVRCAAEGVSAMGSAGSGPAGAE